MNKSLLIGAAATIALAACATGMNGGGGKFAGSDATTLAWNISDLCKSQLTPCIEVKTDASGNITGLVEHITQTDGKAITVNGGNNFIIWFVTGSSATFDPNDGISFSNPPAGEPVPPATEFTCRPYLIRKAFACVDQNRTKNKFYYSVHLNSGSRLDPHVINN
jgi:hypothetical protein